MATDYITLGSGKLYLKLFEGTVPTYTELCKEENRFGYIKNGASIEYTPTFSEVQDDLGFVSKTVIQEEAAILKAGVMTFGPNSLAKLSDTARVETSGNVTTMKIGGANNSTGEKYVICFHHHDAEDNRDIYIMIVGKNTAGFSLSFAKDAETVIDAEFKCLPNLDEEGTLIQYVEVIGATQG